VLQRLLPYADRQVVNGRGASGYGSAAHHVAVLTALLGRHEEAAPRFEAALRANAELGSRPWVARTQERYAAMLLETGDFERARELAAEAAATARELGIQPLADRAQRLLDRDPP
jgi:tetratricopeptide (TPR) repeat protein